MAVVHGKDKSGSVGSYEGGESLRNGIRRPFFLRTEIISLTFPSTIKKEKVQLAIYTRVDDIETLLID